MKSVFLILYLYHFYGSINGATGGPSMEVCEEVGEETKKFVDKVNPYEQLWPHNNISTKNFPTKYICIQAETPICTQKKN